MNHDITFCANHQQCKKASTCRRADYPKDVTLSWAAFWKPDQNCEGYWPNGKQAPWPNMERNELEAGK